MINNEDLGMWGDIFGNPPCLNQNGLITFDQMPN